MLLNKAPWKTLLSLLDQLTPTTFSPMVFFYPSRNDDPKSNIILQLKRSLSLALDLYYPLSGRLVDNLFSSFTVSMRMFLSLKPKKLSH
ncbi:hypothetical protein Tsubulata_021838 [Turnera subulata]|uniref:Uncharacterized protein n=1 Tax=Turnera subulata TaxID=218843 RepID=A0A9Q0G840_9ROSI|nr:hypothetical protein Tsubulata_021838 [Turnera subulata]